MRPDFGRVIPFANSRPHVRENLTDLTSHLRRSCEDARAGPRDPGLLEIPGEELFAMRRAARLRPTS